METLIQSQTTRRFFNYQTENWADEAAKATTFTNMSEAVRVCLRKGLTEVQFVVEDRDDNSKIVVPFE